MSGKYIVIYNLIILKMAKLSRDKKQYMWGNIPFICQEMTDFFGDKIAQFMAQFCVILEALED